MYKSKASSNFPTNTVSGFLSAVDTIRGAKTLNDLNEMRSLHLEKYKG
jgi:plasmid maintenance system killer protein